MWCRSFPTSSLSLSGLLVVGTSAFPWLVTVLTSTHLLLASSADSPGALGVLPSFPMVVRTLAVGPGFFLCFLPDLRPPSGSGSTGSFGFSSPLRFPTFAMGSPLQGRGLSVLDRNQGLVSPLRSGTLVRFWLDLPPLFAGLCAPGPQGVLPGGPRCVLTRRFTLALSRVLHGPWSGFRLPPRPLLGVWGCLSYPILFSAGWGWCLGRLLSFAPCSHLCPLSGCTSLRLWVLGGFLVLSFVIPWP